MDPRKEIRRQGGGELARDFFSIYREDVGDCLEFSQCPPPSPPSLHVGFHFAGYRL